MRQLSATSKSDGVAIGLVLGFENGTPLVVFPGNPEEQAIPAKMLQAIRRDDVGCEVALLFEGGDLRCPLIVGRIVRPESEYRAPVVVRNGEVLEIAAAERLELRCGSASLVLHKDGRITVRGTELVSRASGSNRIRGGSVHIN